MMANSVYVGHLGPIPLYVHWSVVLLLVIAWNNTGRTQDIGVAAMVLCVLILSIVLHELGHGLAARSIARNEGERTVTITLWAMGGLCMSKGDQRAVPRLIVVLAGPLVSLVLWLGAWGALEVLLLPDTTLRLPITVVEWLTCTMVLNKLLFFFNMLPIYPLDGGQTLYNGLKLIVRDYDLAAKMTMCVSIVAAIGYVWWCTVQADYQPQYWLMIILGWALWNAWFWLGRYR